MIKQIYPKTLHTDWSKENAATAGLPSLGYERNKGIKTSYPHVSGQWLAVATMLFISCTTCNVPGRVEEPVSPLRQSSTSGATNNPPFPKMP